MDSVIRYVPTYVSKRYNQRTLMRPAQGRATFATAEEAKAWIEAVIGNNHADTIAQIWGANPQFEVRPCPCWPVHFDPKTCWFD